MAVTFTERSAVPFHLGLTEPIDEATITGSPAVPGGYDPETQQWRLPDGTPLTDPRASITDGPYETPTICHGTHGYSVDDLDFEY